MTTRRQILGGAGALGVAAVVGGGGSAAMAQTTSGQQPAPAGVDLTPQPALDIHRQGNSAFLRGEEANVITNAQRRLKLAGWQQPFAAYVTCSDSRV
ncbi:MAG: hypothetical protein ACT6QU_19385, partial [Aliihoeflea sp.]